MLFILFVLGICALYTSGWISAMLWVVFYGLLIFAVFSIVLHWCWHIAILPPVPIRDEAIFRPDTPYHWRYNEDGKMNIPTTSGGLQHEALLH